MIDNKAGNMARRAKDEQREKLLQQISEWNENRLDLFALSAPNDDSEFTGVMRFFFQDDGEKVATKCIRVSSTATTADVLDTLVEKFRPDMRMLSLPEHTLYEVHVNGEERQLGNGEVPLMVQLNWGKDDREGRFLLKRERARTALPTITNGDGQEGSVPFKRKLSKREKKEQKKKDKEDKLKGNKENQGVAERLYTDLPDTSFTRTISNPEIVMKRRRQQKLEKKLEEIKNLDEHGGTLKIYGETINANIPYKSVLLSSRDTASFVVKETLDKYGIEKENPDMYCLVKVVKMRDGSQPPLETVLDCDDCPLTILMQHPEKNGSIMFELRRRTPDMPPAKKRKHPRGEKTGEQYDPRDPRIQQIPKEKLPFLIEINPDGSEPHKAMTHRLSVGVTTVGNDRNATGLYLKLVGKDIHPKHCMISHNDGMVTLIPSQYEAESYINTRRIKQTAVLQNGAIVQFGRNNIFRFIDPMFYEKQNKGPQQQQQQQQELPPQHSAPPPHEALQQKGAPPNETTFDADGHVETKNQDGPPAYNDVEGLLPATLEFREDTEDPFLMSIIMESKGSEIHFKLAPTYTLYMCSRFRLSRLFRPNMNPSERENWVIGLSNKVAHMIQRTIQDNRDDAASLSFWMANASELLNFLKQDVDLCRITVESQDILAETVQNAFDYIVHCFQGELRNMMPAFLDESREDLEEEDINQNRYNRGKPMIGDVLKVLSGAMSLLRRCRVNAALTIQLFSQLFHYINMWLFNKLVTQPQLRLCTRIWGHILKRRLSRLEIWAEKQGLELAADCHLARIIQAAHLLEAPKNSQDDISSISSTCFKLNSLQLQALLENYIPVGNEPPIPGELINSVVAVARNTADELTRSDGRDVRLEEEPDLQLPFLLPEDGYSVDIVKGIPNGFTDFIEPLERAGFCRLTIHKGATGSWKVYLMGEEGENLRAANGVHNNNKEGVGPPPQGGAKEAEVILVSFAKVNGSMGLSIVAAKGETQKERGIYIKSVVAGGAAAQDGRLEAGDQLMEVDGKNLIGLTQEKAAELMTKTGHRVNLKVAKQGAIYHGLATLLSQPSPVMQRASPNRPPPGGPPHQKMQRPVSENMSRYNGPNDPMGSPMGRHEYNRDQPPGSRPINMQLGARSSPALAGARSQESLPRGDGEGGFAPPQQPPQSAPNYRPDQREINMRSKSTSNLDRADTGPEYNRHTGSVSTLPRAPPTQQQQGMSAVQRLAKKAPSASQPNLNKRDGSKTDIRSEYENYPSQSHPMPPGGPQGRDNGGGGDYVNQRELRNQQYQPNKTSKSMSNLNQEMTRNDFQRARSDELGPSDQRQNRAPPVGGNNPPIESRIPANNQKYQQNFYYNTQPRDQDGPPPFDQMGTHERPSSAPKPNVPNKPPIVQSEVPRVDTDNRNRQPNFFDPKRQQPEPQKGPYGNNYPDGGPGHPPSSRPGYPPSTQSPLGYAASPQSGFPPSSQGYQPPTSHGHQGPPPTQQPPYGGYPPHLAPSSSQSQPQYQNHQQTVRVNDLHPPQSATWDRASPAGAKMIKGSPELPPPPPDMAPELPPPPEDLRYIENELPPPPPAGGQDYETQLKDEQDRMMRRFNEQDGARYNDPYNRQQQSQQRVSGGGLYPGNQQPPPQHSPSYGNYQNLPPASSSSSYTHQEEPRPSNTQSWSSNNSKQGPPKGKGQPGPQFTGQQQPPKPEPQTSYVYGARPAPPTILTASNSSQSSSSLSKEPHIKPNTDKPVQPKKPPPPISAKPKLIAQEIADLQKKNSKSPWERDQKEQEIKMREEALRQEREYEVVALEARPYLSPEEQERLRRLRLEQEFDRRAMEVKDDDDDDDNEISASARAKMVRHMQEEAEKRKKYRLRLR